MGIGRWLLKNGYGSPGQLTKDVLGSYLYKKSIDPSMKNEEYILETLLFHFKNILPNNAKITDLPPKFQLLFERNKNRGIDYSATPISFFEELCIIIDGDMFPFVITYVLLYSRSKLTHIIRVRDDVFSVIESIYVKLIPMDRDPLIKHYDQIELLYIYILKEFYYK
jgi:hypothetical protein